MVDLSYLETLNAEQREAVFHSGSPLLILAGAGSGKTRVITTKIAYLVDALGIPARSILAVTFTNKAAREMYERALQLSPRTEGVMIKTFHSFGAWLLRLYGERLGLARDFAIYDDEDARALLSSILEGSQRRHLSRYAWAISRAKDYALGPEDDLSSILEDDDFPELYARYEDRLRDTGNVDFGDLILLPLRLLKEHEDVRRKVHAAFRVVMVDEYQDSNVAQFFLLRELYGPETYLCVVGDEDQSIYRFRGAEVRNILDFPDAFEGTHIVRLETNYRSTATILRAASGVIAHNEGRLGKTLRPIRQGGDVIRILSFPSAEEEAAYWARFLREEGWEDVAVLYRAHYQSRLLELALAREGVPYRVVGSLRFYEREEVKDLLAFLRLVLNPRDEVSFLRVINKPPRGIGAKSQEAIISHARGTGSTLVEVLREGVVPGKAGASMVEFARFLDHIGERLSRMDLASWMEDLLKESGLWDYYQGFDDYTARQKLENLQELLALARSYPGGRDGLLAFLEYVALEGSLDRGSGDGVVLITMHNTKGLEFSKVIITGLEEGVFPSWAASSPEDIEEERRLFYVALTRAKDGLFLSWAQTRNIRGRRSFQQASRFLREIPPECLSPSYEEEEEEDFPVGSRIYHDDYGYGMVVERRHNGNLLVVKVRFETGYTCEFLPSYTPLERIRHE
ncbi:ATP-dependent helicase [Spirochaeta thermophila]|uniref:DNA 3'-5' helicase n=1 Tax=Winmispira thermophila (strain ATCC 49972 / DSM 6192 / RI 19.B1) TaxID=665571 RepID=E0RR75_WINT6|nr:ATP-dependent helicase [Spirochaeta thermophila]ADN03052.1 DNA helicase [Spirochaeta thermophila DSM 6192]